MPEKEISGYIKWENSVIGLIDSALNVTFTAPEYNEVVSIYTRGERQWKMEQYTGFLAERIISRNRRDIEHVLCRYGLPKYDVLRIAGITRGIHPKDLLWIARDKEELYESAMTNVFASVFRKRADPSGDGLDTPEGYNI